MKFTNYKLITLVVILLIFHVKLFSQHEFLPGYIITNTKDTVHGLIDDKSSISSLNVCLFKKSLDDEQVKYNADDILGYRFNNGRYFVSYKLVSQNFEQHVFFEYLIKAKIDVYRSKVSESGT